MDADSYYIMRNSSALSCYVTWVEDRVGGRDCLEGVGGGGMGILSVVDIRGKYVLHRPVVIECTWKCNRYHGDP